MPLLVGREYNLMKTVMVDLEERSYRIYIGRGILGNLGSYMKEFNYGNKTLLVSNPKIPGKYGLILKESLAQNGFEVITGEIGDGEAHKTLATAEILYDLAFTCGLDRRCPVIALGGGVTGDTAGFVAATYLRGVPFIQVPTTLLAQVDSSVGGKVAVNHPRGKNIIGAFYQPDLVLADTDTLATLPVREIRSGLAEVIKHGVIADYQFFEWLEENIEQLQNFDPEALAHAVAVSCRIKARVVEKDETEHGLRAILNFGHTVGHAVEALTGYLAFNHGEAVAIGMAVAARLSVNMGILPEKESTRIINLIRKAGLPVDLPEGLLPEGLLGCFQRDKKVSGGRLTFVLPERIGRVSVVRGIDKSKYVEFFNKEMQNII